MIDFDIRLQDYVEEHDALSAEMEVALKQLSNTIMDSAKIDFTRYFGQPLYEHSGGVYLAEVGELLATGDSDGGAVKSGAKDGAPFFSASVFKVDDIAKLGETADNNKQWDPIGKAFISKVLLTVERRDLFCLPFYVKGLKLSLPLEKTSATQPVINSGWFKTALQPEIEMLLTEQMKLVKTYPFKPDDDRTVADLGPDEKQRMMEWVKRTIAVMKRLKELQIESAPFSFVFRYKVPNPETGTEMREISASGDSMESLYSLLRVLLDNNFLPTA